MNVLFDLRQFVRSFRFALSGVRHVLFHEQNFRVHLLAAVLIFVLGWYFHIELWKWIVLLFVVFGVILMELVNSVFEKIVDILKPRLHPYARVIKDMMAGAVLLVALLAVIVGVLIFWTPVRMAFFS